jgi:hypothetical protein
MNSKLSLLFALSAVAITTLAIPARAESTESGNSVRSFNHAELFAGTSNGQKKAGGSTKGTLVFDSEKKMIEFQAEKSLLYEQAAKPRYTEAVLISPMFLPAHSKKHCLTIQYTDASGAGQFAIIHLDKKNAQQAAAAAQAETGKNVERAEEK